jgi:hypothetical protein
MRPATRACPAITPVVPPPIAGVRGPPVPVGPTGAVLGPKDPLATFTETVPVPLVEDVPAPAQDVLTPADPQAPGGDAPPPVRGALESGDDMPEGVASGLGLGSLLTARPPPGPG